MNWKPWNELTEEEKAHLDYYEYALSRPNAYNIVYCTPTGFEEDRPKHKRIRINFGRLRGKEAEDARN